MGSGQEFPKSNSIPDEARGGRSRRRRSLTFEVFVGVGALSLAGWVLLSPPGRAAGWGATGVAVDSRTIARGARVQQLMGEHREVSFAMLSAFDYGNDLDSPVLPAFASQTRVRIPEQVSALHGQRVAVSGFMLPLDFDGGSVGQFILNANQDMCMFGAPTVVNQLIVVTMNDSRRTALSHLPIRVFGTVEVGEERTDGRLVSLYRMRAEAIASAM